MGVSSPTNFVANQPSEYVASGTMFAANVPATEFWATDARLHGAYPGSSAVGLSVTRAAKDVGLVWRAVLGDISLALASSVMDSLRAVTGTAFTELGTAFRSALRDVVLGATMTTGELVGPGPRVLLESTPADQEAGSLTSVQDDRRLYALAAVEKLQRLLRVNQDEVSALVHVSRPTLWHWQQGRVPQERSIRHLHNVAAVVDLLVDAVGGEALFDPARAATMLALDEPLTNVLAKSDGPTYLLRRLFAESRRDRRPTLMPGTAELDESVVDESHAVLKPPALGRRAVRRRSHH